MDKLDEESKQENEITIINKYSTDLRLFTSFFKFILIIMSLLLLYIIMKFVYQLK
jgi:hypothetical protein